MVGPEYEMLYVDIGISGIWEKCSLKDALEKDELDMLDSNL